MATVLEHGTAPEHLVRMHPFFGKAVVNTDPPSRNAHPLGLDGAADDNGQNPHRYSNPRSGPDAYGTPATREPPTSLPAVLQREHLGRESWATAEVNELDDENTRRKRRRLSVDPEQQPVEVLTGTNPNPMAWHDQLQDAASTYMDYAPQTGAVLPDTTNYQPLSTIAEPVQDASPTVRSAQANGIVLEPVAQIQTSCGSPSLLRDIGNHPSEHNVSVEDFSIAPSPAPQAVAISTPKKKDVILKGNGTLAASPKRSPRRSPRTKSGEKKVGTKSKKVEMRNGKFVSSLRISLPYTAAESGKRIDEILSGTSPQTSTTAALSQPPHTRLPGKKGTHPFFLGKPSAKAHKISELKSEASSTAPASEDESNTSPKPLKPWKDIMFGSKRSYQSKINASQAAIWPPSTLQHIRPKEEIRTPLPSHVPSSPVAKSKHRVSSVKAVDDVLQGFSRALKDKVPGASLHLPTKAVMSGKELSRLVEVEVYGAFDTSTTHPLPLLSLKSRIEFAPAAFDKGFAAGPYMWPQEYAPNCWQEVLQPQSQVLHDWLDNLRVHQVQSGASQAKAKLAPKKPRRKRKPDEMDDFIAHSDEEDEHGNVAGKNAILITGPPGCGKTASVFAVAKQLGFEVFEIHSGMRRSAKDIQDKVGDMTQNHLVQQSDVLSRQSSFSLDRPSPTPEPVAANKNVMARFMGMGKPKKQQTSTEPKESKTKLQKQSLILFEEVDVLFDDDKGFWSGVQSLMRTSKRPVIMTCNDLRSVPLDELDLFAVLTYDRPQIELAAQQLEFVAAAEGHLLSKQAVQNLYLSKGQDFRASLNELNLWCQMTIGSEKGGLDWMLSYEDKHKGNLDGSITRIVSQDSFISGLDLLPTEFDDSENLFRFAKLALGISPLDWIKDETCIRSAHVGGLQAIDDMLALSDSRSAMDMFDLGTAALLADVTKQVSGSSLQTSQREEMVRLYLDQLDEDHLTRARVADTLEALMEETRIGLPVSPGRKAPSLDNDAVSVVTEVAPYVRAIVSHDQMLERIRYEIQEVHQTKRQRKTRASRAALEGGDKVSVRRDKWFPESLDFAAVLATGNGWPQFRVDETPTSSGTPSPSMETDASETQQ